MKQLFLEENIWSGGVFLDDEVFRKIVQPSFGYISLPEPDRLYLPMKVNGEGACRVIVSVGQYVERYGIVGIRDDESKQNYHVVRTDLPGYVEAIGREQTGYRQFEEYVELRVCGEQKNDSEYFPCNEKADEEIGQLLMTSGIPGINRILFDGNRQRKCQVIILNAVMDDPSLFYDTLMIKERPGQILYGLLIFFRLLEADEIFIVAGRRQQDAAAAMIKAIKKYFTEEMQKKFFLLFVPDLYPGGRDELLNRNLEKWMNERTRVMLHMDQVLGAYDVVYDHKPWTRRALMIGGCMPVNGCCELPVGTRLKDVVHWLHPQNDREPWRLEDSMYLQGSMWLEKAGILIDGGLMAGDTVNLRRAVVHSGMNSLLILPRMEENEQKCLECARCEAVCPAGIVPWAEWKEEDRIRCIGCGSCSYICPSRRRLKEFMLRGGRRDNRAVNRGDYIELPSDCGLFPVEVTGYSSPYIRRAQSPFTCILSPFKL